VNMKFLTGTTPASLAVFLSAALWGMFWIPIRYFNEIGINGEWAIIAMNTPAMLVLSVVFLATFSKQRPHCDLVLLSDPDLVDLDRIRLAGRRHKMAAGRGNRTWLHRLAVPCEWRGGGAVQYRRSACISFGRGVGYRGRADKAQRRFDGHQYDVDPVFRRCRCCLSDRLCHSATCAAGT